MIGEIFFAVDNASFLFVDKAAVRREAHQILGRKSGKKWNRLEKRRDSFAFRRAECIGIFRADMDQSFL